MQAFFGTYGKVAKPINGSLYNGASSAVQSVFGSDINTIAKTNPAILTTNLFGQSIYTGAGGLGRRTSGESVDHVQSRRLDHQSDLLVVCSIHPTEHGQS